MEKNQCGLKPKYFMYEDKRRRDSDAKRYCYLKIIARQPITIKDLMQILARKRTTVYYTLIRLYRDRLCTRQQQFFDSTRIPHIGFMRYIYSITESGLKWLKYYELTEDLK